MTELCQKKKDDDKHEYIGTELTGPGTKCCDLWLPMARRSATTG